MAAMIAFQPWLAYYRHWELAHLGLVLVCIDKMYLAHSQVLSLCGPGRIGLPQGLSEPEMFPTGTFIGRVC